MDCKCNKSSRDIYCEYHGDEQYLRKVSKKETKPDKKKTMIDKV